MARTVNEAAHARRRDEFLDAAQRLIETKSYEQMSIQDVLTEANASKGAFYHYFGSKQELLSAVVDRFATTLTSALSPIAADPTRSALEKLRAIFTELTARKDAEREALVRTLRVWYSDDNVRVRQKARTTIIAELTILLTNVVGELDPTDPEMTSRVLATLLQDLNDELADQLTANEPNAAAVERTTTAYTRACERLLHLPENALTLDMALLRAWLNPL